MDTDARTIRILKLGNEKGIYCWDHLLLIGANHRIVLCRALVVKEQIEPKRQSTKSEMRTSW
jgi:hypothetical protein